MDSRLLPSASRKITYDWVLSMDSNSTRFGDSW